MDLNFLSRFGVVPTVAGLDQSFAPTPNVFQALNVGGTPNVAPPAAAPASAPRERHSIIDTIGRIADTFATVGGAQPLYQPTIDARQDRAIALADHARSVDLDALKQKLGEQKIEAGQGELDDAGRARLGQAIRGVQAIIAANPGADVSSVWPLLARQAGVDDNTASTLGTAISENPSVLSGLAASAGVQKEFGLQPFYATDANGKLSAYQLGKDGSVQAVALPEGAAPIDPLKFVDTGGTMTGVGTRSGAPVRILPKTEAPGRAADRASREKIAAGNNATQIQVQGMKPAGGSGSKPGSASGSDQVNASKNILNSVGELKAGIENLRKLDALQVPGGSAIKNTENYLAQSRLGQAVSGAIGTPAQDERNKIKAVAGRIFGNMKTALNLGASQLNSDKEGERFMATINNPQSSYGAMMDAANALEKQYKEIIARNSKPAAATPARPTLTPRRSVTPRSTTKPSVSNW